MCRIYRSRGVHWEAPNLPDPSVFRDLTFYMSSVEQVFKSTKWILWFSEVLKKKRKKNFFSKKNYFLKYPLPDLPVPSKGLLGSHGSRMWLGGTWRPLGHGLVDPPQKKFWEKKVFLILINQSRWGPRQAYSGLPEVHLASGIAQGGMTAPISTICEVHPPKKTFWIKLFPNSPPTGL